LIELQRYDEILQNPPETEQAEEESADPQSVN
jgi:hypothetical protein